MLAVPTRGARTCFAVETQCCFVVIAALFPIKLELKMPQPGAKIRYETKASHLDFEND
jgi:hypothetical protein